MVLPGSDLFGPVLAMGTAGSVLAAVLLFRRAGVIRRLSGRAYRALWLAVLTAFTIPIPALLSLPVPTAATSVRLLAEGAADSILSNVTNWYWDIELPRPGPLAYLPPVWLAGWAALAALDLWRYLRLTAALRRTRRAAGEGERAILVRLAPEGKAPGLYRSPLAPAPMLVGLFRPAVYLPEGDWPPERLEDALAHELAHFRGGDLWVKWWAGLAARLHWLSPLAWLARREVDRACELACDEAVLRGRDEADRRRYGETLLFAAGRTPNRAGPAAGLSGEKETLKERLDAILERETVRRMGPVLPVLLALCAAIALGASSGTILRPSGITSAVAMSPTSLFRPNTLEAVGDLTEENRDELIRMVNACPKTLYPMDDQRGDISDIWIRLDQADGSFYQLHYDYCSGFSFNPLHFGEDDYYTLLTHYSAQGEQIVTWKLDYAFDQVFSDWWWDEVKPDLTAQM